MASTAPGHSTAKSSLPAGTTVGRRFRVQAFLGQEAGTELYQVIDLQTSAPATLRWFPVSGSALDIVKADMGQAARVSHKNLERLLAWGTEGPYAYVATEARDGATLRQLIDARRAQNASIGTTHAHVLLGHMVNALEAAHTATAHGGLNPAAVRVTSQGQVHVCNLGLSRALPELAKCGGPSGQAEKAYLAPEILAGAAPSPAADVYSLTAVLYELLTSHVPGSPVWPPSQMNSSIPPAIDAVVARGLAPLPEVRFSRPSELMQALDAAVQGLTGAGASQPAAPAQPPQPAAVAPRLTLGKSFSVADAVRMSDEYERWLIQKDKLDYGPFSLAQVMAQMEKGVFSGDDIIVDADSGDRKKIRDEPQLAEFARTTERRLETQRRAKAEQAHEHVERKKGRLFMLIVGSCVVALAIVATVLVRSLGSAKDEDLASRVSEADIDAFLKDVKVEFRQPKRAGGGGRRSGNVSGGRAEDLSNNMEFGDASQGGGDAILDEGIIDKVMRANYRKLVPCMMYSHGVSTIELDFAIAPTGKVVAARVNGQLKSPLSACVLSQMQSFGFPSYKGKKTLANWSMSIR